MNENVGIRESLTEIYHQLSQFVVDLVPRLVTGLAVLIIGIILAKILEKVVGGTLSRIKFDAAMERVGLTNTLQGVGVKQEPSRAVARLIYLLLVILFLQSAANAVGLAVISQAIESFFAYLPNLVAAVLIILLGNTVGQFARRAVEQSGRDSGLDYAPALGRAVSASILFIVAIMAITQLGIDTAMINTIVIISLAGSAAAFALSFGLGTREITRNIVAGFYLRKLMRAGDEVEALGESGTLTAITATKTVLERDGRLTTLPNSQLIDSTVRR